MTSLCRHERSVHAEEVQFRIALPMRFRIVGERAWHDAWTDSMSLTEIVFTGDDEMEIGKTLDVRVVLPQLGGGQYGGAIVSKAKVTRSWSVSQMPGQVFCAAALTGPRLLRLNPENRGSES